MSSNDQKFHSSGPLNPIHFQKMNFRSCWHSPVFPPKTFYKTETRSFAWGKCWDAASGTALQAWDPWQALRARAGVQRGKGSGPTLWLSPCRPPLHPDTSAPPSRGGGCSQPLHLGWPTTHSDQQSPAGVELRQPRCGEHRHCGNRPGQPAFGGTAAQVGCSQINREPWTWEGVPARLGAGVSWETGLNIYTLLYIK